MNYDTGRFRNFMSHGRQWLEDAGSEDSHARALWAVGTGAGRSRNEGHRQLCAQLFERGLPAVGTFTSPRAWAFTLLGIHEYLRPLPGEPRREAGRAKRSTAQARRDCGRTAPPSDWPWFETERHLRQRAPLPGPDPQRPVDARTARRLEIGLKSLRWLVSIQKTQAGHFRPIGSNGFYQRDGARADFDQQPVEAQAMVSACLEAFRATRDPIVVARGASAPSSGFWAATTSACRSTIPAPAAAATGCTTTGSTRTRARSRRSPSSSPSPR